MNMQEKFFFSLFFSFLVSACSAFDPYVVSLRDIETESFTGENTGKTAKVSICYNSTASTEEDVQKLADEECGKLDAKAKLIDNEEFVCSLFASSMAEYICLDKNTEKPVVFNTEFRKNRLLENKNPPL